MRRTPYIPSLLPAKTAGAPFAKSRQGCNTVLRRFPIGYLRTVNWVTINVPVLTAAVFR